MDIRQNATHVPTRPIAFVIALLALAALAITAWSVLRTNVPVTGTPAGSTITACSGLGPDAQERCVQTIQEQQSNAELHHGH